MYNPPLVSIIIPVFNGSDFMRDAIDSALAQTYNNIEVIVVNDGSRDDGATRNIALSYGDSINYIEKNNGGVASALNTGIENMKGSFFSWLSHDDVYIPDKIEKSVEFFHAINNDSAVVYTDYSTIDFYGNHLKDYHLPSIAPKNFRFFLTRKSMINGCSLLIPKILFNTVGLFRNDLITVQDYDLWFRMASFAEFHHLPQVLVKSRQHPNQGARTLKDLAQKEQEDMICRFLNELTNDEIDSPSLPAEIALLKLAKRLKGRGQINAMKVALKRFHSVSKNLSWGRYLKGMLLKLFLFKFKNLK
jgi:glycosyltransferase involved in cell wall biosynthesis